MNARSLAAASTPAPRGRWRGHLVAGLIGALLSGTAVGAVGHGWGGAPGRGQQSRMESQEPASLRERAESGARWLLQRVDATPEQEAQVHAIVAAAVADLIPLRERHRSNRRAWLEEVSAASLNAGLLAQLRGTEIELADQTSARLLQAVTEVAAVLTPAQRRQLSDRLQSFHG